MLWVKILVKWIAAKQKRLKTVVIKTHKRKLLKSTKIVAIVVQQRILVLDAMDFCFQIQEKDYPLLSSKFN